MYNNIMNLIYVCVFHQESYISLLKLLITSVLLKSNINKNTTDILIITSPRFEPIIGSTLASFDMPLHYYTLDIHTLFDAGCARLNIFKYNNINKYDNILYLDTDILLNSDINVLFDLQLSPEKIYVLEEGLISEINHGSQFFDFTKHNINTTAFTSGILLFKNSDSIKSLFDTITTHIIDYIQIKQNKIPDCLDQPFIVYNAVSQNKYDNQVLKKYVENNPSVVSSNKIVYHFPGGPGDYTTKYSKMINFWRLIVKSSGTSILENKKYSWENESILFLKNGLMSAFGKGNYTQLDTYIFEARFGGRIHSLIFNNDYTKFKSKRYDDNNIVEGTLLYGSN